MVNKINGIASFIYYFPLMNAHVTSTVCLHVLEQGGRWLIAKMISLK